MKDLYKIYFDNEEEEGDDIVTEPGSGDTPTEETPAESPAETTDEEPEYETMDVEEMTSSEVTLTNTYTVDGIDYTWNGKETDSVNGVGGNVYRRKNGLSNDVLVVITTDEGDATVLRRLLVTLANGAQSYKYYELKVADSGSDQQEGD